MLFSFTRYDAPEVYVMLQKEMAERIVSRPGQKSYGALSVTLGFYYEAKALMKVPREAFYPRPDVASSFLVLSRRASLPLQGGEIGLFHALVKSAFWGRRKTLLTALSASPHLDLGRGPAARLLEEAGIDGGRRGEELGRDEFVALARAYRKIELPDLHRDAPQPPGGGLFKTLPDILFNEKLNDKNRPVNP